MFSHEMIKSTISLWKNVRSTKFKELGHLVTDVYNINKTTLTIWQTSLFNLAN
jgi:hypothetical protein